MKIAVSKEGLLPGTTSNVAMEDKEQERVFHSVASRAAEIYDNRYLSLRAELGCNQNL